MSPSLSGVAFGFVALLVSQWAYIGEVREGFSEVVRAVNSVASTTADHVGTKVVCGQERDRRCPDCVCPSSTGGYWYYLAGVVSGVLLLQPVAWLLGFLRWWSTRPSAAEEPAYTPPLRRQRAIGAGEPVVLAGPPSLPDRRRGEVA